MPYRPPPGPPVAGRDQARPRASLPASAELLRRAVGLPPRCFRHPGGLDQLKALLVAVGHAELCPLVLPAVAHDCQKHGLPFTWPTG